MKRIALLAIVLAAGCTSGTPSAPPASPIALASPVLPSPVVLPAPPEPSDRPDATSFQNVDLVLPSWGTAICPTGRIHLGVAAQYEPAKPQKVITVASITRVDFDGDGTDEYAVYLLCGEGPEAGGRMVAGYRRVGRAYQLIGRITGAPDGIQMMEIMRRKGNGIEILVSAEYADGGQRSVPSQWRTYGLRSGRLRQVSGPTSFPAHPAYVSITAEPHQLVLRPAVTGRTGTLAITVRNKGTLAAPVVAVHLRLPTTFRPAGPRWSGCTTSEPGSYSCTLTNLAPGSSTDVTLDLLAPLEAPVPGEFTVDATSEAIDVYDQSSGEPAPLSLLFP